MLIHKYIYLLLKTISIILLAIMSNAVFANCVTNRGGAVPLTTTATMTPIVVQRDAPNGEIGSIILPNNDTPYASCDTSGSLFYNMSLFRTSVGNNIYLTNVHNVGISVDQASTYYYTSPVTRRPVTFSTSFTFYDRVVRIYKLGDIDGGTIASGVLATNYGDDGVTMVTINLVGAAVSGLSCSLNTPSLTFPIGDVLAASFGTTVGTIPPGAQNTQNLGLNCNANANITVTLMGTQNPDVSNTSVLALSGQENSDVASGVGVQLLYGGNPLVLNTPILLKTSTGGAESLPLTARYYQTKNTVTTGKANASATLNITYQ